MHAHFPADALLDYLASIDVYCSHAAIQLGIASYTGPSMWSGCALRALCILYGAGPQQQVVA
jgi:hypothetical protein